MREGESADRDRGFFSLLFLTEEDGRVPIDGTAKDDLNLNSIVASMVCDGRKRSLIENYTNLLCRDGATVNYRLDILEDLLANPRLVESIADVESHMVPLKYYVGHPGKENANPLQESVWRLRELEEYLYCVETLHDALGHADLSSPGLGALREFMEETYGDEAFQELRRDLPPFLKKIGKIKSLTIGINLNEGLIPFEAAIVQVNPCHFGRSHFFPGIARMKGSGNSLGPLHTTRETAYYGDPTMIPLFKDLSDMVGKAVNPLKESLRTFGRVKMLRLIKFSDEFTFYLGAIKLIDWAGRRGLPMVRPVVRGEEEEYRKMEGLYNLDLALRTSGRNLVTNDFTSVKGERSLIITGPNNGGKTTFLQAVGIAQYLAQLGMYVPASRGELSLCRNIYTHYPNLEISSNGFGRFVEEAGRLTDLIGKLEPHSLVLLNETLSSTNMEEAAFIAEDVLDVIGTSKSLTLFVTHMHRLAAGKSRDDRSVKSLVAQVGKNESGEIIPSFKVMPSQPEGKSYAREIARQYKLGKKDLLLICCQGGGFPQVVPGEGEQHEYGENDGRQNP